MSISGCDDATNCKMFVGTLKDTTLKWFTSLQARSVTNFDNMVGKFITQFAKNRSKLLEVEDLFDVRQRLAETLKSYLARFNGAMVHVKDPDQKFFIKAYVKACVLDSFTKPRGIRRSTYVDIRLANVTKPVLTKSNCLHS